MNLPSGVALSPAGILQTSQYGFSEPYVFAGGSAFLLSPTGRISNLHLFTGAKATPPDGAGPLAPLAAGPNGLYYGTTADHDTGLDVVFQISDSPAAPNYAILHEFGSVPNDGGPPSVMALTAGPNASLYGVTSAGGLHRRGTVYALSYAGGAWSYKILHSFGASGDVSQPQANVVLDSQGNVFGCGPGGRLSYGGIFKLTPPAHPTGNWIETVVFDFGSLPDYPNANSGGCGVAIDPANGRLIGTTTVGGASNLGAVFEVDPPAGGQTNWTGSVLHSFDGSATDGEFAAAAPTKVGASYYGSTETGTIFAVAP